MTSHDDPEADARLDLFLDHVTAPLCTLQQKQTFAAYAAGLLSDAERKSMEPLAAQARPDAPGAAHKAFCYFTGIAVWNDRAVRRQALAWAPWGMTARGEILGTILDDTGMLKQGKHSVGVGRQYTGSAGKIANCQIAVTMAVYSARNAALADVQLYLPKDWTDDAARMAKACVPSDIVFRTKGEIALEMLQSAYRDGVPLGKMLLADADYGRLVALRRWCRDVGMEYGVGIHSSQRIWDADGIWTQRMTVGEVAAMTERKRWRRIAWKQGSEGKKLSGRFAFLRVQITDDKKDPTKDTPVEWLVMEWRDGESGPERFYLMSMPEDTSRTTLIRTLKERWRIEKIHEEIKGEVGFDHFEGRSWPGWHHHSSVALSCHALLIAERCVDFSPWASRRSAAGPYRRPTRPTPAALRPDHPAPGGQARA
jgi:SRSO17 transposase